MASTSTANDAGAAAAATTQSASTSNTVAVSQNFDSPFGKPIPQLYGDVTCLGQLLWTNAASLDLTQAEPFAKLAFAVAFGQPDPQASAVKFVRIWANGNIIYDASGTAAIQTDTSYNIRMYYGTETQVVDPALDAYYAPYSPAFRGLIYLVFDNFDIETQTPDGQLPQIIAEIEQTGDGKLLVAQNTAGANQPYLTSFADQDAQTITYIGANGFDVYAIEGGGYLYSVAATPLSPGNYIGGFKQISISDDKKHYWAIMHDNTVGRFDLSSNTQDIAITGNLYGPFDVCALPSIGKWDEYVAIASVTNQVGVRIYGVVGTNVTLLRTLGNGYITYLTRGYIPAYPTNLGKYAVLTDTGPIALPTGVTGYDGQSYSYDVQYKASKPIIDSSSIGLPPVDDTTVCVLYAYRRDGNGGLYRWIIGDLNTDGTGADTLFCARPTLAGYSDGAHLGSLFRPFARDASGAPPASSQGNAAAPVGYEPLKLVAGASDPRDYVVAGPDKALVLGNVNRYARLTTGTTGVVESLFGLDPSFGIVKDMFADDSLCALTIVGDATVHSFLSPWNAGANDDFTVFSFYSYGDVLQFADYKTAGTSGDLTLNVPATFPLAWFKPSAMTAAVPFYNAASNRQRQERDTPAQLGYVDPAGDVVVLDLTTYNMRTTLASRGFKDVDTGADIVDPLNYEFVYSPEAGVLYGLKNDIVFLNSSPGTGQTNLANILTSIAEGVGYDLADVVVIGLADLTVQGVIVNTTGSFTDLLASFASFFRFKVYDAPGKINLIQKSRNQNFMPDAFVNESDLCPNDNSPGQIAYDRDYVEDLPTFLTVNYIDVNNDGAVGTQTVRRTKFPQKTTSADQTVTIGAPVIIDVATAVYYGQFALYDIWAQAIKLAFRLPSYALQYDPSDIIQITLNDGEAIPVQLTSTSLNADKSVSCEGTTMLIYNTFSKPGVTPNLPTGVTLTKSAPSFLYLPDNILVYPGDDTQNGVMPYRWTSNEPAYLYIKDGSGNFNQQSDKAVQGCMPGVCSTVLPPVFNAWPEIDRKTRLTYRPKIAGAVPRGTDYETFLAGGNVAFVGAPGRWEMIFFRDVSPNADGSVTLSFLARGRRGSDAFMSVHAPGETIFFLTPAMPLFRLPADTAGMVQSVFTVQQGSSVKTATLASFVSGGPLVPWRPCDATATLSGSDIVISWSRRSRLAGDITGAPLDDVAEVYDIELETPAGAPLRHADTSVPTFTYTQAMQEEDGFAGGAIVATIAQVSSYVGFGYPLVVTLNPR